MSDFRPASQKPYRDFTEYFQSIFPFKVQKISINAGFTCPNRDGASGHGGCAYCNNRSFTPDYTSKFGSITQQIEDGKRFFSHKYPEMKYLAYFQSYTNTYGDDIDAMIAKYEEALSVPDVVGIIIGTRPDCMPAALLDYFETLSCQTFVYIEYGVESTLDPSLERINRGHDFATSINAIEETARRGIPVGAHLIIGLPGEGREDFVHHISELSKLPITSIKLHQLQILKGTILGQEFLKAPASIPLLSPDEYLEILGNLIAHLREDIYIDRFVSSSPADLLIAPKWNIKNHVFTHKVLRYLQEKDIRQGMYYKELIS
ncbi:TIGR01212 family radical SAM protein [Porphyromonas sp.]|uniref:TIGR01212 family radical SAM protein n=1 Tax=Porphyromonas sp. TaxID=1924944 RepID=UPI0026DC2A49|nr:TIGR01212 family radical SAM protein [Porphyromonas sp.]MDO4770452.1 TIGR01212 family radical SAM protein [Porphyromonas sp.]